MTRFLLQVDLIGEYGVQLLPWHFLLSHAHRLLLFIKNTIFESWLEVDYTSFDRAVLEVHLSLGCVVFLSLCTYCVPFVWSGYVLSDSLNYRACQFICILPIE